MQCPVELMLLFQLQVTINQPKSPEKKQGRHTGSSVACFGNCRVGFAKNTFSENQFQTASILTRKVNSHWPGNDRSLLAKVFLDAECRIRRMENGQVMFVSEHLFPIVTCFTV